MIDVTLLDIEDIGQWVRYKPSFGKPELGRLKSWNHVSCFVVFQCDKNWDAFENYTAQSTSPQDLTFVKEI